MVAKVVAARVCNCKCTSITILLKKFKFKMSRTPVGREEVYCCLCVCVVSVSCCSRLLCRVVARCEGSEFVLHVFTKSWNWNTHTCKLLLEYKKSSFFIIQFDPTKLDVHLLGKIFFPHEDTHLANVLPTKRFETIHDIWD